VHYCNIDARRCHELLRVRNVIADRREIANLSYTSMYDALFRAGGMKIRNLCIAEGIKPEWNIAFSCISTGKKDDRKYPGAFVVPPKKGLYRDHRSVKRRRRSSFQTISGLSEEFEHKDIDPEFLIEHEVDDVYKYLKELFDPERSNFDNNYPPDETSNDQNSKNDRPCSGKDFSSLYPSLIMTYNFSPEKAIENEKYMAFLRNKLDKYGRPYKFVKVSFRYGLPDQAEEEKELVEGWFVQHTPIEKLNEKTGKMEIVNFDGMGLYPYILKVLYDIRAGVKKKMDYYSGPKEFLEKFFEKNPKSSLMDLTEEEQKELLRCSLEKEKNIRQEVYNREKKNFYKWKIRAIEEIIEFFNKEYLCPSEGYIRTCVSPTIIGQYEECVFFFTYYNSKQLGLKVFMNTAYGETGNSLSPFFIKQVAGAITTYGQKNLKFIKGYVESKGWDVKYGDSVTADTPILVRFPDKCIAYRSIDELSNGKWNIKIYKNPNGSKTIKYESQPFVAGLEVWSDNGWTKIQNIIRHYVGKRIFRVLTHTGCVDVTEDHSLLNSEGVKVKPGELSIGYPLMHANLPLPDPENPLWNTIPKKLAWIYGFFYAEGHAEIIQNVADWQIVNKDINLLNKAQKILTKYEPNYIWYIDNSATSSGRKRLLMKGKDRKTLILKYVSMFYNLNKNKKVPDEIINTSFYIRRAFYNGYCAGDGKNNGKIGSAGLYYLCNHNESIVSLNYHFDTYNMICTNKYKSECKPLNEIKKIEELTTETYEMVYDLTTENHHFAAGVGKLIVSNTDSLYVSAPEPYFIEVDKQYETGQITKKEYWTKMIEITMEKMDLLCAETAELLYKDNGTRFLKLAYEEVLFPYAFVGKKKYIGIQHQGIVNLGICAEECTLKEFMESKLLFIRGLEVKKRGSSEFLKKICYEVMKEAFCITSTKTLKQIVQTKLQDIVKRKFAPELFVKSARYRLPGRNLETGKPKPGNVTVLKFVSRMKEIEEKFPSAGIKAPEIGERFNYIVAKKYPWTYDLRGRKVNIKVGDKYEYFESMENEAYLKVRNDPIEIDSDYYISNEIIGQFARFLTYHPDYDKFYPIHDNSEALSLEESDERYKAADKKAHNYAKKQLKAFYKTNFAIKYPEKGKKYQKMFKETNRMFREVLQDKYGDATEIFNIVNTLTTGTAISADIGFVGQAFRKTLSETILEKARKEGVKKAKTHISDICKESKQDPFTLYRRYVSGPTAICKVRVEKYKKELAEKTKQLKEELPKFEKVCAGHTKIMDSLISTIRQNDIEEDGEHFTIENDDISCQMVLALDADISTDKLKEDDTIYDIYNIYISLVALYKALEETRKIKEEITFLKDSKIKRNVLPPTIKKENIAKEFSEWLTRKNNSEN
jgi:DNA polymerase elongation subunit (family B)